MASSGSSGGSWVSRGVRIWHVGMALSTCLLWPEDSGLCPESKQHGAEPWGAWHPQTRLQPPCVLTAVANVAVVRVPSDPLLRLTHAPSTALALRPPPLPACWRPHLLPLLQVPASMLY